MAVSEYTLELFPESQEVWTLYSEKFGELFRHTSHSTDGSITFYRKDKGNAGLDLYVSETKSVTNPIHATLLNMGIKARMTRKNLLLADEYVHYWMPPRSSIWKSGVTLANSIGVIDRSYRGNLMAAVLPITTSIQPMFIEKGARIVQIVAPDMGHISEVILRPLDQLDTTERGEGGFGSTGR